MTTSEPITPSALLKHTPRLTAQDASALVRDNYGLQGCAASALPSERDQNFLIATPEDERFVLKISNGLEDPAFLDAQQCVLEQLAKATAFCPRIIPTRSGTAMFTVNMPLGSRHDARLVTYLPGVPMARVRHHSPELLRDLGRCLGTMDIALADFDHPALHRHFHWDLAHALRIIGEQSGTIADLETRTTVQRLAEKCNRVLQPLLPNLRRSVIHGDANDYNVLVDDGTNLATRHQRVVGVIDYGDIVHSFTVGNLAIAAAYALLDKPDPLAAAAYGVEGYHGQFPLNDAEIAALFSLICLRLGVSACMAQVQQQQRPGDDYLAITQRPLRRALPRLLSIHPRFAEAMFRRACGRPPCPTTAAITQWLRDNAAKAKPLLDVDLRTAPCIVFDLSIASPLNGEDGPTYAEPPLTAGLFGGMHHAGVSVGVGRFNEPRLVYATRRPLHAAAGSRWTNAARSTWGWIFLSRPAVRCTLSSPAPFTPLPITPHPRIMAQSSFFAIKQTMERNFSRCTATSASTLLPCSMRVSRSRRGSGLEPSAPPTSTAAGLRTCTFKSSLIYSISTLIFPAWQRPVSARFGSAFRLIPTLSWASRRSVFPRRSQALPTHWQTAGADSAATSVWLIASR